MYINFVDFSSAYCGTNQFEIWIYRIEKKGKDFRSFGSQLEREMLEGENEEG